jgi:ribonuclease Z
VHDPAALYEEIRDESGQASLGYLCDVGRTVANMAAIEAFLPGLTLLCAECTFLRDDLEKARASCHLCSSDLNELTGRLAPRWLLPMHLSKSYLHRTVDLYAELRPPVGTTVLRLPKHIVPPPLGVEDVAGWLRPRRED